MIATRVYRCLLGLTAAGIVACGKDHPPPAGPDLLAPALVVLTPDSLRLLVNQTGRVGVAVSAVPLPVARPAGVLRPASLGNDALRLVADEVTRLAAEEDGVSAIVVGLPRRLDGSPTTVTARVKAFANELGRITGLPIVLQDERLTSREAESRLAATEKDWRVRKRHLDAAAAAIILQDYLDAHRHSPAPVADDA